MAIHESIRWNEWPQIYFGYDVDKSFEKNIEALFLHFWGDERSDNRLNGAEIDEKGNIVIFIDCDTGYGHQARIGYILGEFFADNDKLLPKKCDFLGFRIERN